jgi:hypothetical protein
VTVAGCSAEPTSFVNTFPESAHAEPQRIRSSSWRRRCARRAATAPAWSAMVRSPASLLGCVLVGRPTELHELYANGEAPGVEVDIRQAESARLAMTQAAVAIRWNIA